MFVKVTCKDARSLTDAVLEFIGKWSDCFRFPSPPGLTLRQAPGMACLVVLRFRVAVGGLGNVQF